MTPNQNPHPYSYVADLSIGLDRVTTQAHEGEQ